MPAGDNPHSISEKKAALRESPKEAKNADNQQPITSPMTKGKAAEIVGIKRHQPNVPWSPTNYHMLGNPGANGRLVYVRRRLETDQTKGGTSASAESVGSVSLKRTVISTLLEQSLKHQNNNLPHAQRARSFASPVAAAASPVSPSGGFPADHSFGKQSPGKVAVQPSIVVTASPPPCNLVCTTAVPQNFVSANGAPCYAAITSAAACDAVVTNTPRKPADLQRSDNQYWKERFIRLQAFLRHNEQSGQEEYIHMLRSLSSAGRSKHAIQLENRAINLLIEEGKELQKMKVLNVLGKLSSNDHPSVPPTQPSPARHPPFQTR